jgi:methylmalonyl-CoA mutase
MLWARIVAAFGGSEQAQQLTLHARTSAWTKSRADAYNNMLRATSEAFAAVMGGCTSLHVSPFDEALGLPDEFSRRIARNVQIILREECSFARLIDPSGGSWAVERLTDELAREAWALFQELERRGGMAAALAAGFPQAQIAATRSERLNQIALRREVIVGVNMYANLKERPVAARPVDAVALQAERRTALTHYRAAADNEALQAALAALTGATGEQLLAATLAAARAGATLGALVAARATQTGPSVEPLPAQRGAEQFEGLRSAAEAYAVRNGTPPAVFLATMGPLSQSKARADFATSFFETGGFVVTSGPGYATPAEAAQAALASNASIVLICATDEAYPALVPALAGLIKAERPDTTLVLAGYPTDQIATYQAAGIDEFIHLRADCYAILARLQQLKGVHP